MCIRDRVYSAAYGGKVSYYRDRYGLEADCVLHLRDGRYALIEFKLGSADIDEGAKHLIAIEKLVEEYNRKETQVKLRLPDLKIVITGTQYGYRRPEDVYKRQPGFSPDSLVQRTSMRVQGLPAKPFASPASVWVAHVPQKP